MHSETRRQAAVNGAGIRREVLITRPAGEAAATADRVAALGWRPVVAPFLRVATFDLGWNSAADGRLDGIVVTSGNALPALDGLRTVPLLAVGDATAARARASGFERVASAGGAAADLVAAAPQHFAPSSTLLLATADGEGIEMAATLQAAGFVVRRRLAYSVSEPDEFPVAAADALARGHLHAALFFSARTARSFARLLPAQLRPELAGVDACAIGQPSADVLTPLPWRRVRVSLSPTLDQVLALL